MKGNTKIGDFFSVQVTPERKRYFQYIANDLTQLNSDVIRAFKEEYPYDTNPDLSVIVNGEIDFYAHCITKLGVKMKLWERVGNIQEIGNVKDILFRGSRDYGVWIDDEPVRISHDWYVWKINEKIENLGSLEGENRQAYIGLVINPLGIIELLKGNKYPINYPDFE